MFDRIVGFSKTLPGSLAVCIACVASAIALPTSAAESPLDQYTEQTFIAPDGQKHRYRLMFPVGYEQKANKKYPLVLFLHGAGERGDDNFAQLKHGAAEFARADRQSEYPCFVLVPQVPKEQKWVDADWSQSEGNGTFPDSPSPAFAAALGAVKSWIDSGDVDPSRVYVTGLSMGGYGTWYAAAAAKDVFAAAVPICGGGDPTWAKRYEGMPIWTFHGTQDKAVPVGRSQEMIEALSKVGHKPEAIYTPYEGGGHDVWTETYRRDDLFRWLFSQHRSAK
ncbi:MAG TPA: phospholipase [Planctomycetaceae bacterium]|nr:phospholipase [Planctomycetaceae bacterium]